MLTALVLLLRFIGLMCRGHRALALENVALRQQLVALTRDKRPHIRWRDRLFWILLAKSWPDWRSALIVVQPGTVLRWHREWLRCRGARRSKKNRQHYPSRQQPPFGAFASSGGRQRPRRARRIVFWRMTQQEGHLTRLSIMAVRRSASSRTDEIETSPTDCRGACRRHWWTSPHGAQGRHRVHPKASSYTDAIRVVVELRLWEGT